MTDFTHEDQGARLSDSESLVQHVLHRSASVSIYDVRCRPHSFARGPEECAQVSQIAFPRHGLFERETRGERAIADANQVLFFNADEPYHITHPAGCGDDCTVFVFDAASLREAIYAYDPAHAETSAPPFRFAQALSAPRAFMVQEALRNAALLSQVEARGSAREQYVSSLVIDEAAFGLLHTIVEAGYRTHGHVALPKGRATLEAHQATAQRTCLVLAQNFREDLSLEAIARSVYASPFHLARVFRKQVGLSIHQYRHRLRLRQALLRVADGEENLARLALELGFASHSHLTDSFRQAFGEAPAKYRKLRGSRALRDMSRNLEVPHRRS